MTIWYVHRHTGGSIASAHGEIQPGYAEEAKVLWDKASRYERHNPLLVSVAMAAGKTSDDLDALFRKTLEYE